MPKDGEALHGLALAALVSGDFDLGIAYVDAALRHEPENATLLRDKAMVLSALGRNAEAISVLTQAVRCAPDDISVALRLVELSRSAKDDEATGLAAETATSILTKQALRLERHDRFPEARRTLLIALSLLPSSPLYNILGLLERNHDLVAEAIAHFHQALVLEPADCAAMLNLGTMLRDIGRLADAETIFERILAIDPGRIDATYMIGLLRRYRPGDRREPRLEVLQRTTDALSPGTSALSPIARTVAHHALGKWHEDLGRPNLAFDHYAAANSARRQTLPYRSADTAKTFEAIANFFPTSFEPLPAANPTDRPIFIVGMPRSGTTLAEQILSSHPAVHGAGELTKLASLLEEGTLRRVAADGQPATDFPALAERYLEELRRRAPDAPHVVDKAPHNFMFLGFIHLMLPNARIIHCMRDPRDVCWSCFKTLFVDGHAWSCDLEDLGRYYLAYQRLMAHWHRVLPGRIFDLRYEDLVGDFEPTARRLVAHCGLDWTDACLQFHKTERSVRTASAAQVRQPIYGHAIGQWQIYAEQLRPLITMLEREGCLSAAGLSGQPLPH
ncbi:sulfotransferase [Telmatospirillum sp.]|uniref:tetratricopeptide repeat-containing sulfotransferase family protein n=1 Tax=Telmatospirillum sp. TaxID=2079197 RepID=UPI00283F0DFA|nr:sulfotransferase [Telmatospirillum sp.]MDR3440460.1 sulfotransferase [Telmatospirillum sp.]